MPMVPRQAVSIEADGWTLSELESLADDVAAAIVREVPEYSKPDGSALPVVHQAAKEAARDLTTRIAGGGEGGETAQAREVARMFRGLGRAEATEGRSPDTLYAALRVGLRVTWRWISDRALRNGGDARMIVRISEIIYHYFEELRVAGLAGFAEANGDLAGQVQRLRRRLLGLLLADPPAPPETIAGLARAADWTPPRQVAVVALAHLADSVSGPLPPLPPDVLSGTSASGRCLVVPDPDGPGRRRLLDAGLRALLTRQGAGSGPLAAVGPSVALGRAADSLRWARQALDLARRGAAWGADQVVACDDHLAALMLVSDVNLAGVLSTQALAPLRKLKPELADRLAETLLAWLDSADNAGATARRLHIHPQTVRYRLRQLEEMFGDRLTDPDARFTLQAALRARRLLAG